MKEVYASYDILGQNTRFESTAGQYIGFSRGYITTWVDFGEDELHMSVSPKRFSSIHAIAYKDIADVEAKRYMNLYFILLTSVLAICALLGVVWALLFVALTIWAGLGSKIQIKLNNGQTVAIYSAQGLSDAQGFAGLLKSTVDRAKRGEVVVPPENTTGDSALDLFVLRDVDSMPESCRKTWDAMLEQLHSGKSTQQLIDELCMQNNKAETMASAQVNPELFQEACRVLSPHLMADEQVFFCKDETAIGKVKEFVAFTNKRILFYYKASVHGIQYGNIYKMAYYKMFGRWYINSLPLEVNESLCPVSISNEQVGLMLAIICKKCEEQMEPEHRIVVCDSQM